MENLRISLVQTSLVWENKAENLKHLREKIIPIAGATDLVILPEMFNTGFTMNTEQCAEKMTGETIKWMRQLSRDINADIIGSLIIKENKKYFNRLVWVEPWDIYGTYDKRHLFRMANEQKHFSAGNSKLIRTEKGWNICPLICYDLRFPVWCRNKNEYDLLIFIANWPEVRSDAWKTLLKARAIENQCYVAGVNIVGTDGNQKKYAGDSAIFGPSGALLTSAFSSDEKIETISISYNDLAKYRKEFPVGLDADNFEIFV
jgi:predicted amidohydrolase